MPDFDPNAFSEIPVLRLCRIRVLSVGDALPCQKFMDSVLAEEYNSDSGSLALGPVCPVNYPNGEAKDNRMSVQAVFLMEKEGTAGKVYNSYLRAQ